MKVICTQENLKNGLVTASKIINQSSTLPILSNILLETKNGSLTLQGTNLEVGIKTTVRCKIELEGSFCINAKLFTDLISTLPNQNITLEAVSGGLLVNTDQYSGKLKTLPPDDYPGIPDLENGINLVFPSDDFKKALEQVVFAVSINQTQPEISGVLLSLNENVLKLVATDRYRLAEKSLQLKTPVQSKKVVVPSKTIQEIIRIISNHQDDISLVISENQISAQVGDTEIVSRLIDGQFPDYEQIIPISFITSVTIPTTQLSSGIRTSGLFSQTTQSISLAYNSENQEIELKASSHDLGESVIKIPSVIEGGSGTLLFNHKYILDVLSQRKEPTVTLHIVSDTSPVIITPENDTTYQYLVMPIKT
jgi:DNA polymerase-3 subunit beta